MNLTESLRHVVSDLTSLRCRFAVVGGLAVSAVAEPRLTLDVDIAVAVGSDREAEALIHQLLRRGYQVAAQLEQDDSGRLVTVRLRPPRLHLGGPIVDILFAASGIEAEVVAGAEVLQIAAGLRVPVARREHLIAMKVLSHDEKRRPKDRADLVGLIAGATPEELVVARKALELVVERGFARSKDLIGEFRKLLSDLRPELES